MRFLILLLLALSASWAYSESYNSDSQFPESRDEVENKKIGSVFDNFKDGESKNPITKLFGDSSNDAKNTDRYAHKKNKHSTKHPVQFDATWSAAMQILADKPIAVSDSNGGIISTDWYQDKEDKNKQRKINVLINKSGSVKVTFFKRTLDSKTNQWIDDQHDSLNQESNAMAGMIVKRAKKLSEKE